MLTDHTEQPIISVVKGKAAGYLTECLETHSGIIKVYRPGVAQRVPGS